MLGSIGDKARKLARPRISPLDSVKFQSCAYRMHNPISCDGLLFSTSVPKGASYEMRGVRQPALYAISTADHAPKNTFTTTNAMEPFLIVAMNVTTSEVIGLLIANTAQLNA